MKHDFLRRELAPLKVVPYTECGCIECQKSALYNKQFADRMLPFEGKNNDGNIHVNQFSDRHAPDNFDLTDLKLTGLKALAYINGRPDLAENASAIQAIKAAKESAIKNGTNVTYSPDQQKTIDKATTTAKAVQAKADSIKEVGSTIVGFIGSFKWILIGVFVIIIVGVFLRIKG